MVAVGLCCFVHVMLRSNGECRADDFPFFSDEFSVMDLHFSDIFRSFETDFSDIFGYF